MSAKVSECERPGRKSIGMICIPAEAAAVHAALALQSAGAVPNLVRGKLASQNLLWLLPSPRHKPFRGSTIRFVNGENSFPIHRADSCRIEGEPSPVVRWFCRVHSLPPYAADTEVEGPSLLSGRRSYERPRLVGGDEPQGAGACSGKAELGALPGLGHRV